MPGDSSTKPTPRDPEPDPGRYDVKIPQVLRIDPLDELGKARWSSMSTTAGFTKRSHLGVSKNRGKIPKMDGENNGSNPMNKWMICHPQYSDF